MDAYEEEKSVEDAFGMVTRPAMSRESPTVPELVEFASAALGMLATEIAGFQVKVPPELVMVEETVTPLLVAAEEVAKVMAPVWAEPYAC